MSILTIKSRISALVAFGAIAVLGGSLVSSTAYAQAETTPNADTVIVSPPITELSASPGQALSFKLTLTNATTRERNFSTETSNAVPKGTDGAPDLVPDDGAYALKNWVKISPATTSIAAGGSAEFTVNIAVPSDAGPGSHSGGITFTPSNDPTTSGAAVSTVAQISSLMLINVSGATKNDTKLVSFDSEKSFYQHGPVKFTALFRNDGNVVARPEGEVRIKNMFGKTIATLPITTQRVLPTASRTFEVTLNKKSSLGRYSAELVWHADTVSAAPSKVSFWSLPLSVVLPVIGILIVLFLLVWLPRKRLKAAAAAFRSAPAKKANDDESHEGTHTHADGTVHNHDAESAADLPPAEPDPEAPKQD